MQSISLTLLAVMQRSNSRRHKCPSWNVSLTGMPIERHIVDNATRSEAFEWVTSLMMKGRNNGKKLLAVRIVAHAFEIIHLLTDQNPIQVRGPSWDVRGWCLIWNLGARGCDRQHRSSRGLDPYWFAGHGSSPGRRRFSLAESEPGDRAPDHRCKRI